MTTRDLVIIGGASDDRLERLIDYHELLLSSCDEDDEACFGKSGLAGIIISCGDTTTISSETKDKILKAGVPALFVSEDTAMTEKIILKAFESTKMQLYDTVKHDEIVSLFEEHFEFEKFLDAFNL